MCRFFQTAYACGHRDNIEAPCEWRDTGVTGSKGENRPCKITKVIQEDLTHLCLACSPRPFWRNYTSETDFPGQKLVELGSSKVKAKLFPALPSQEMSTEAIMVRNEAHLRKRAQRAPFIPGPTKSFKAPSANELQVQYCVNEEFLTRRAKRNLLIMHLDGKLSDYQVYCDAANSHSEAKAALKDSVHILRETPLFPITTWNLDAGTQTEESFVIDIPTETNGPWSNLSGRQRRNAIPRIKHEQVEDLRVSLTWENLVSNTSSSGLANQTQEEPKEPERDDPLDDEVLQNSLEELVNKEEDEDEEGELDLDQFPDFDEVFLDGLDELLDEILNSEGEDEEEGRPYSDQFAEYERHILEILASSSLEQSEEQTGQQTDEQSEESEECVSYLPLDSLQAKTHLVDMRHYLGMRYDATPREIHGFYERNEALRRNIRDDTLPLGRRLAPTRGKREGFNRDPGLTYTHTKSDEGWEARTGFKDAWKSIIWQFPKQCPIKEGEYNDDIANADDESLLREASLEELEQIDRDADVDTIYSLTMNDPLASSDTVKQCRRSSSSSSASFHSAKSQPDGIYEAVAIKETIARVGFEVSFGGNLRAPRYQPRRASGLRTSWTYGEVGETCLPLIRLPLVEGPISPLFEAIDGPDDSTVSTVSSLEGYERRPRQSGEVHHTPLVHPNTPEGEALLARIGQLLAMPPLKTPQELSLFIDRNPGLMKAIRAGRVPTAEPPAILDDSTKPQIDGPLEDSHLTDTSLPPNLKVEADKAYANAQKELEHALRRLDWDEIDSQPLPLSSLDWERAPPVIEDGGAEEGPPLRKKVVFPSAGEIELRGSSRFGKYRAKQQSPLRTSSTVTDEESRENL